MIKFIKDKIKILHLLIIFFGAIFIILPAFHSSLWFDESYSVAMAINNNFSEIWNIGGHDVHPVLYYWMLRIVYLFFGNNIMIFRLFSTLPIIILGILGFTHIKKDFGEKTGLLFTFFIFFLPINMVYASEIRMYTWAMLFVTVMAIYAYRIYKNDNNSIKNWSLFAIFSLMSAYTHYYGLMTSGIINLILFIYLLKKSIKIKSFTKDIKLFIVSAITQIILYIPWLIYFFLQVSQVSNGFWIDIKFPDTLIEIFSFQFTGNLTEMQYINNIYAILYGLVLCIYIIYIYRKNKNNIDCIPAKLSFFVYISVILAATIISIVLLQPILYARYLFVITGLFIFTISYIISKIGKKVFTTLLCCLTIVIAVFVNLAMLNFNYNKINDEFIDYIKENIKENDIVVFETNSAGGGFVVSADTPNSQKYFINKDNWGIEEAYKAYGKNMNIVYSLDFLENYTGRIFVIDTNECSLSETILEEYSASIVETKYYNTKYQSYEYTIVLIEK